MHRFHWGAPVAIAVTALLAACDQATVESGIEVEVTAVSTTPAERCAEGVTVGTEGQSFCTAAGERIDLINGLTAPFPVRAIACPSVAAWLLDALLPAAFAHGGHIAAPPGVVDVAEATATQWTLGALPLTPGHYCGVEISLERLPAAIFTDAVPQPHDDIVLYARPCHYPNPVPEPPASNHQCHTVPVRGLPATLELAFPEPVTLDADSRTLHVEIAIDFATWFDGVDFATLASDATQQQLLLDNALASLSLREHP